MPQYLTQEQCDAMDALFAFSAAMTNGQLSVDSLSEVFRLAIKDGGPMLHIQLLMATIALKNCGMDADSHVLERDKSIPQ